ncbi:MAG: lysophospholipid acyltransferase family protein [Alphaproteobacteria bacterium]
MLKSLRYTIEAILCGALLIVFKCLPVDAASGLGGWLARNIGTKLAVSRKAYKNLSRAFPDMDEPQKRAIIKGMWDNLGRVFAEYPHIKTIAQNRVAVENAEIALTAQKEGTGAIFISGHLANWEVVPATALLKYNIPINITYRKPNNPMVDRLVQYLRSIGNRIQAFPKSAEGGRQMIATLKNKGFLAVLIDQKYNEGLPVAFFGHTAMTNPIAAQLAGRYRAPVIPARCIREKGANFRLSLYAPIPTHYETGHEAGQPRPLEDQLKEANQLLEGWIREYPEQWIWLHKRWGNAAAETNNNETEESEE